MRTCCIWILTICLWTLGGCRADDSATTRASRRAELTNPVRLVVVLTLADGLVLDKKTDLRIVVKSARAFGQVVAVHSLTTPTQYPATFQLDVQWPELPERGGRHPTKSGPPDLVVYAVGRVDESALYIAPTQAHSIEDAKLGRPIRLSLIATRG